MVQHTDSRAEFVARLKEALHHAARSGRGEGSYLKTITGVTPKAASKWLNGETRPGHDNLVTIAKHLGVREEWLIYGHGPMVTGGEDSQSQSPAKTVEAHAAHMAELASPRSKQALEKIAQSARDGRLTEDDLLLLEQIANRIAARSAPAEHPKNNPHERLKDKLGNNDSSSE